VENADEKTREFHFLSDSEKLTLHVRVYAGRYAYHTLWRLLEGHGYEGNCIFSTTQSGSRELFDQLALSPLPMKHSKRIYEDKSKTPSEREIELATGLAMQLSKAIRDYLGREKTFSKPKTKSNKGVKTKSRGPRSISEILSETYSDEELFPEPTYKVPYSESLTTVIPDYVLDSFTFSNADKVSVTQTVEKLVEDLWLTWDNHESVIRKLVNKTSGLGLGRWGAKYPEFDKVLERFRKEGRDPLQDAVIIAWFVFAISLIFVTVASPYVLAGVFLVIFARKYSFKPTYSPKQLVQVRNAFVDKIESHFKAEITRVIKARVKQAFGLTPEDWSTSVNNLWKPLGPRPIEPKREMTPAEAEEYVGQLLRYFGVVGAKTTRYSRDGGIDVEANEMVTQVKHQQNPVGVAVVREIFGVATHKGKLGAVFAKSGFTKEAIDFAQNTQITLITYLPRLKAHTNIAQALVDGGWPRLLEHRDNQK
jgi:hypothetical protein